MTKPLRSMVYSHEGTEFIGIYSTSYTSTETRNPDSRGFMWCLVFRFTVMGFVCCCLKESMQKTRGSVTCTCGEALQHIRKTLRFTVSLQQSNQFTGICSTSHT